MLTGAALIEFANKHKAVSAAPPARSTTNRGIAESGESLTKYLEDHGVHVKSQRPAGDGVVLVLDGCPMNPEHGTGTDTAVIWRPNSVGFECKHNGCQKFGWKDVRRKIDPTAYQANDIQVGNLKWDLAKTAEPPPPAPKWKPFPVKRLFGLSQFVIEVSKAIGCDASFVILPLLTALAAAIGNTRRIMLKRGWTEPAIIWSAIIGESGSAKSPALEMALRFVRAIQRLAFREFMERMKEYEAQKLEYEKAVAQWKKAKGDDEAPTAPEKPTARRYITDDCTTEALAVILAENWRGVLVARDELRAWFGSFDRYSKAQGADAAKWIEVFHGRSMTMDRRGSGILHVERAAASVTGSIQPNLLRKSLTPDRFDDGMAARLLLAMPPRKAKQWTEDDISEATERRMSTIFQRLYELEPVRVDTTELAPGLIRLSEAAKRSFVSFVNVNGLEQVELDGELAAAWSKLEAYVPRIALVLHLVRWADGDPAVKEDVIDHETMNAAIEIVQWFTSEIRRIYLMLSESEAEQKERRLRELIARCGGKVKVRDVLRHSRLFKNATEATIALDQLVKLALGRWEEGQPGEEGGRPFQQFVLNTVDTVDVDTTPAGGGVDEGSVNLDPPLEGGNVNTADTAVLSTANQPPADTTPSKQGGNVDETPAGDPVARGSVNVGAVNAPAAHPTETESGEWTA